MHKQLFLYTFSNEMQHTMWFSNFIAVFKELHITMSQHLFFWPHFYALTSLFSDIFCFYRSGRSRGLNVLQNIFESKVRYFPNGLISCIRIFSFNRYIALSSITIYNRVASFSSIFILKLKIYTRNFLRSMFTFCNYKIFVIKYFYIYI